MRLHHVQVCCPPGGEDQARLFYADGLGMAEAEKPVGLLGRGGVWFGSLDDDGALVVELHVGVEDPFGPARTAHPAFVLASVDELEDVAARLERLGFEVDRSEWDTFPGYRRVHTNDAHGNRVELLA